MDSRINQAFRFTNKDKNVLKNLSEEDSVIGGQSLLLKYMAKTPKSPTTTINRMWQHLLDLPLL